MAICVRNNQNDALTSHDLDNGRLETGEPAEYRGACSSETSKLTNLNMSLSADFDC